MRRLPKQGGQTPAFKSGFMCCLMNILDAALSHISREAYPVVPVSRCQGLLRVIFSLSFMQRGGM